MSIRTVALFVSLSLLTSCAKPYSPASLPPSLCVEVRRAPPVPEGAAIVQPATEAEREGVRVFLNWVAEALSVGEENADRAEEAKARACGPPPRPG